MTNNQENLIISAGIDEAGRGPLAGDVFASAVILKKERPIPGLNDSKKLSEKKREELYQVIIENALDYAVCRAEADEIDRINILQATFLAMNRCIEKLTVPFNWIRVDGNQFPFRGRRGEAVVKGDSIHEEIMAASILAKVSRDRYMMEQAEIYPQYRFDLHKGYPTKLHVELLEKYGPCPIHRRSFYPVRLLQK